MVMPLHEFLINVICSTVLNMIPYPSASIAPSGVLGTKFGYAIRLTKFGEIVEKLMKKKGAKVPDLLLVNEEKSLLIIVECKSDFTFKIEESLSKQIEFYSSKDFKAIYREMFPDLTTLEIWVCSPKSLSEKISVFISRQVATKKLANIVVWGIELKKAREEVHIKKFYGNHLDSKLDEKMDSGGLICSPPRIELLVDPTLTNGERAFRIGRRFLSFIASSYLTEKDRKVTLRDFRERHPDAIMTDNELKRCLRYLSILVPEIGKYNSVTGEVVLAKRPSLDKIKTKLENIGNMTYEEFKVELARISIGIKVGGVKHPKAPQKTKISDFFSKKKAVSKSSGLSYPVHDVELLYRQDAFLLGNSIDF